MTDIVERLRAWHFKPSMVDLKSNVTEAADEIEQRAVADKTSAAVAAERAVILALINKIRSASERGAAIVGTEHEMAAIDDIRHRGEVGRWRLRIWSSKARDGGIRDRLRKRLFTTR
jgi:hypothetical protein